MAGPDQLMRYKHQHGLPTPIHIIGLMGRYQAGKSVFINQFRQKYEDHKFLENSIRTKVVEKSEEVYWKDANKGYYFVEIPGFQNEPPDDGDGAIIREIAKFLVRVYDRSGFAGLVYLHDFSQSTPPAIIKYETALLHAMIGPKLYDHTALVLNKIIDNLRVQFPKRRPDIEECWQTLSNKAVIEENGPPRGEPGRILEPIWKKSPEIFALATELNSDSGKKRLCKTSVGKVYQELLKKEIKGLKGEPARRHALEKELEKWKKCTDTYDSLRQS